VLSNQHEWINTDKQLFGQPNTAYDFNTTSSRDSADKLSRLQEQKVSVHYYNDYTIVRGQAPEFILYVLKYYYNCVLTAARNVVQTCPLYLSQVLLSYQCYRSYLRAWSLMEWH